MTNDYFSVREMLDLPLTDRLGECSRCGEPQPTGEMVQLRVIGHHVALCRSCLNLLTALAEPVRPPRLADYAHTEADEEPDIDDEPPPDYGPPGSGAVITEYD